VVQRDWVRSGLRLRHLHGFEVQRVITVQTLLAVRVKRNRISRRCLRQEVLVERSGQITLDSLSIQIIPLYCLVTTSSAFSDSLLLTVVLLNRLQLFTVLNSLQEGPLCSFQVVEVIGCDLLEPLSVNCRPTA
jgi:hypothetical protein